MIPQRVLALDVSSTAAGYACFVSGVLDDFGLYKPGSSLPAINRIKLIVDGILDGAFAFVPDVVVMEWSDSKGDGARARRRAVERGKEAQPMSGLVVLGQAQGAVLAALYRACWDVETVNEKEWTGGVPKHIRAEGIALEYAKYAEVRPKDHPGYDIADAIGIGHWYLGKLRIEELAARKP